ncbi:condensin-2 complex subunit H2-like isoform X2 [Penaeus chinensis]|uniref:condensin-2 complex subunit H2-like isoform X2 n=1 Tax=Penaeus chinensis TaxID=139456 RepID=UPI001FB6B764|nr:condensin-2 complex subunit H2-like isoform X2 [Penaeus chinensis]
MRQTSPSQDLEARFSVFLNPIRDLTKNWEVDIAKYLEEYLEELAEVQITFDGGETMMNFAEAAMLIQGSATVYSKKVEFLWQMVLQMLDLLSSRRSVEMGGPAGKDLGGGAGGKSILDASIEFQSVDNIREGRNINMREEDELEEDDDYRHKNFKFMPATPLHLVEKEGEKSQYRINLLMKNSEMFGTKDDFRINRSYVTPMGMLCLEVPAEILREAANVLFVSPTVPEPQKENAEAGERLTEPESDKEIPVTPLDPPAAELFPPVPDVPLGPVEAEADDDVGIDADDGAVDLDDDLGPAIQEEEQPMEVEKEGEEKKDKSKDQENINNNLTVIDLPNGRYGLRRRGGQEKEVVAKLKLTDTWKPQDPHAVTPAKRPIRAGRLRKPLPCTCHRTTPSRSRPKKAKNKENKENTEDAEKKVEKSLPSIETFVTNGIVDTSSKNRKVPLELQEEAESEAAKRLELSKKKRVKELLKEGIAADPEEAAQKVLEENQEKQRIEKELDDPVDCDGVADLDFDDLPAPPMFLPEPHDGTRDVEGGSGNKRLNESQFDEPGSDYEALVQKWVADYITTAQGQVNSSELARRVNKWRDNITPKLNEEEERKTFDIHSYGSQVLSYFPENGRKQTVPFSQIAQNHDSKEVSRLFLSCLMLANTYNIELSEEEPGDFAMDCLHLTLLSRVRHHEELEEYAAPSQASPSRRKGRTKGKSATEDDLDVYPGDPSPICADITQKTLGDNFQISSKQSKKGKVKTKR